MTTYTFYDHIPAQAKYIREEVFVKEQGFHNEFDEIDSRAIHLVIFVEGQAAGTARMFLEQEGDTAFTVGRETRCWPFWRKKPGSWAYSGSLFRPNAVSNPFMRRTATLPWGRSIWTNIAPTSIWKRSCNRPGVKE